MAFSVRGLVVASAILVVVKAQGNIVSVQGTKGSNAGLGLQIQLTGTDANIIRASEVAGNVVNECGRTLLAGNIDIGTETETQLANNTVTSATKGSTVTVNINQGTGTDGAGPYTCDMDFTGNADGTSGQTNLTVKEIDSNSGTISLAVTMPANMACIGSSAGNVCTVRCFNSAAAGPFGGCFAVQQTDITASVNSANTIATAQTLAGITAQIAENVVDLPATTKANQEATLDQQGIFEVNALVGTPAAVTAVAATSTSKAAKATSTKKATAAKAGKKNGNNGRRSRVFRGAGEN